MEHWTGQLDSVGAMVPFVAQITADEHFLCIFLLHQIKTSKHQKDRSFIQIKFKI